MGLTTKLYQVLDAAMRFRRRSSRPFVWCPSSQLTVTPLTVSWSDVALVQSQPEPQIAHIRLANKAGSEVQGCVSTLSDRAFVKSEIRDKRRDMPQPQPVPCEELPRLRLDGTRRREKANGRQVKRATCNVLQDARVSVSMNV